ncbi:hypothetical protein HELRODRAFT_173093 [Helobdella robusta]|uniref:Uncharacterized protein n=1 Tax=Helobdella robusta TaxID=6412 RepID=T1F6C1_HELRO|nr:hypothetical protein HELRODRAFT_173093 [Helobdella robusta]ESO04024.1 hypothetical protein HELRODRAFT_173093 [Helobdella robusta]
MHINCEEPDLANTLIEKNILKAQFCVNYDDQNHNITKFWNKVPSCGKVLDDSCGYPCFFTRDVCDAKDTDAYPPCVYTDILRNPVKTRTALSEDEKPPISEVCPCTNLLCSIATAATLTFPTSTTSSNKHDSLSSWNTVTSAAPSSDMSQTQTLVPPSSPSSSRELSVGLGVGLSLLVIVLIAVGLLFFFKRKMLLSKSGPLKDHITHVWVGEIESKV